MVKKIILKLPLVIPLIAKRLALEFNAIYVEFQDAFNKTLKKHRLIIGYGMAFIQCQPATN